jgi:predicted nucleic acid-binding protein
MQMSNAVLIDRYLFNRSDKILLDTNVWLFIECPLAHHPTKTPAYSKGLSQMLSLGCGLYADVLVISEFINRYARLEHKLYCNATRPIDFKDYRKGLEYRPLSKSIATAVRKILQHAERLESEFSRLNVDELLSDFELGCHDFNDQVIAGLCRTHGLMLITDDADFKPFDIPILTANPRLLN